MIAIVALIMLMVCLFCTSNLTLCLIYTYVFENSTWRAYQDVKSGRVPLSVVTFKYYMDMGDKIEGYHIISDLDSSGIMGSSVWDKNEIVISHYFRPMIKSLVGMCKDSL